MKNRLISLVLCTAVAVTMLTGCQKADANSAQPTENNEVQEIATTEEEVSESAEEVATEEIVEEDNTAETATEDTDPDEGIAKAELEDGIYLADFDTDSGMFHVNESCDGKGMLTVADGAMTIHVSLAGTGIINLFLGTSEDAQKDDAVWLEASEDEVTYDDGSTEVVYGFDIPVPYLNEEFDCALIGKKGVWYDHKVSVSNVTPIDEEESGTLIEYVGEPLEDGEYDVEVILEGGSGKATVTSPARLTAKDGLYTAVIEWSSPNYDFMMVGDEKYLPINTEGNSVFEIPVAKINEPIDVQADTVAMSKPHLIDYKLTFNVAE